MKANQITKHIISAIAVVFIEEIFRTIINNFKDNIIMDSTFLITVPICLILLLGYWGYLYLQRSFSFQNEVISKLEQSQKESLGNIEKLISKNHQQVKVVIEDHALRLGLYYQLLISNNADKAKLDSIISSVPKADLEKIGFNKTDIEIIYRNKGDLSLRDMKNANIKELD
jgi:hypothetical protein